MHDDTTLRQLFPTADAIAPQHRLSEPIHQRSTLIAGALESWDGPCKSVLSPICVRDGDGPPRQVEIGSYPQMAEPQSDADMIMSA